MNTLFRNTALTLIIFFLAVSTSAFAQSSGRGLGINKNPPPAPQRVALVIGNSAYANAPLKNPVNDARDVAQALRELGFEVIYRENINQNDMKRAVRTFGERTRTGGTRLFYYAGHGVQVNGENFLIPIGADFNNEQEVEYEAVNVGLVLAQMEEVKNSINIVVLDACRNNPFARSFRSASRGLASVNAPSGTLIAYATAPGSVASDGTANNGIYTQELLRYMRTPGISVEEIFKRIRISVREKTQGKQTPWESSSLTGDFYFISGKDTPQPARDEAAKPSVDSAAVELSFWDSVKNSSDPEDFKAYLDQYPNGTFIVLAKRRIQSLQSKSSAGGDSKQPSVTRQTTKAKFFTFDLNGCKASGDNITCEFMVINSVDSEKQIGVSRYPLPTMIDDKGNQYKASISQIGNERENLLPLAANVPVKGWVTFVNIPNRPTVIKLLTWTLLTPGIRPGPVRDYRPYNENFKVEFRDIPVSQ
jgi:Caspase domain